MNKLLFAFLILFTYTTHTTAISPNKGTFALTEKAGKLSKSKELYNDCGLQGFISLHAFENAMSGYEKYGTSKPILAICDFSKPSSQERFFIIDLKNKKLLKKSLVAHGKNSGGLMATSFSNQPESLKSSLGFFLIGTTIQTAKHGLALLLEGLEKGVNDNARKREIIIHGADYVSEKFVQQYGYLGKSWGCPALPNDVIQEFAPVLKDGALLCISTE